MRHIAALAAAALLLASLARAAEAPPTYVIHAGMLLATPGGEAAPRQSIIVRGNRIVDVKPGYVDPQSTGGPATVIDLTDQFVLPGLMDMHMHIAGIQHLDFNLTAVTMTEAEQIIYCSRHALRMLEAGYTTIRDVGDDGEISLILRKTINDGTIPGPRIYASGRIITRTGGHGATSVLREDVAAILPKSETCDGVEGCRHAVRSQVERGADLIKITLSGSARDEWGARDAPSMLFPDELDTVMSSAHQLGRPVAVHAHSTAAINAALAAGARTIEHGTYFDDESVRLFEKSGAYLVPTSLVAEFGLKMMENFKRDMSAADWERVKTTTELMYKTSGRAWRAGIKIAAGTDLGTSLTVDNARELGIYVDNGIPATEAIRTATVNAADVIGMADQLGQIRPGYLADIIATRTSPLADISSLRHVSWVMKDGRIYKGPGRTDAD